MMFGNFYEFHIFNKAENILVSSSRDPAMAWWVLDSLSEREDYAILDSFSTDVTEFCENISKQELQP